MTDDIENKARELGQRVGDFEIWFDSTVNLSSPDALPWAIEVPDEPTQFGGYTIEEALDCALERIPHRDVATG